MTLNAEYETEVSSILFDSIRRISLQHSRDSAMYQALASGFSETYHEQIFFRFKNRLIFAGVLMEFGLPTSPVLL